MTNRASSHTGFLSHANFRWAKVAVALCTAGLVAYVWHQPRFGPSGSTWLGYTLGSVAAFIIVVLLWLGVRKRNYRSRMGTVKGWTSFHVYLGLSLLIIGTLHTGFSFGPNIHTAAYVLMCMAVLSGLLGVIIYGSVPEQMAQLREGDEKQERDTWINEVFDLNQSAVKLAQGLGPSVQQRVVASSDRQMIGGGFIKQLRGKAGFKADPGLTQLLMTAMQPTERSSNRDIDLMGSTVGMLASELSGGSVGDEASKIQQLLDIISRRNALVAKINRDIALTARMQVWLLLHVPLSFALLAALMAHVLAVFFYW